MGILSNSIISAADDAEVVTKSCRFDGAETLNRTLSGASSTTTTFTIAFWLKRASGFGDRQIIFMAGNGAGNDYFSSEIDAANKLSIGANDGSGGEDFRLLSPGVLRDPAAWYHVCVVVATAEDADVDRIKLYINGTQETLTGTALGTQSYVPEWNAAVYDQYIGGWVGGTFYNEGYLADFYSIDGTAVTPMGNFIETDATTGQLKPKAYTTSLGTEGFHLDFKDTSNTGKDAAGSNNFSSAGLLGHDQLNDRPTNNYATLNPLSSTVNTGYRTFTEGNLSYNTSSTGQWTDATGTIGLPDSGKWYFEVDIVTRPTVTTQNYFIGLVKNTAVDIPAGGPSRTGTMGFYCQATTAKKTKDGVDTTDGTLADADGEVYMVAVDMDLSKIWIGLEGTWFNSADPADADDTNYAYNSFGTDWNIMLSLYAYSGATGVLRLNAGQDPTFAGDDPVATPATSEFAYTPPTGYSALSTANLPDPTIADGTEHFDTLLYTGDSGESSAYDITGLKFQPDIVWLKARTYGGWHRLVDSVRAGLGTDTGGTMFPNDASGEGYASYADSGYIGAFLSGSAGSPTGGITLTPGSIDFTNVNYDTIPYAAWNWKAGTGFDPAGGSATTDGSKNATAGFSIAKWTGNSSATQAISHGLEAAPDFIVAKARTNNGYYFYGYEPHWCVYHKDLTSNNILYLDTSAAETSASGVFGSIGASTVTMGYNSSTEQDLNFGESGYTADDFIGYFFSEVAGYSKFGSYTANGVADGPFVWCGFKPALVIVKRLSGTNNGWGMHDGVRPVYNPVSSERIFANEGTTYSGYEQMDMVSNGFKVRDNGGIDMNDSGTYIYAAFAEQPFKYAAAR